MDTQLLDDLIQGRVEPYIYAFTTNTIPNYLKIGDTYRPISVRLDEWRLHYPDLEQKFSECAKVSSKVYFRDFAVHAYLEHELSRVRLEKKDLPSPSLHMSREFFKDTSPQDVAAAVADIREDFSRQGGKYQFYDGETTLPVHVPLASKGYAKPRDNQKAVIDAFEKAIEAGQRKLLMYAVMRFGKSFTAMCCAQKILARLVVVVSAKGDVLEEWRRTVEELDNFRNDYEFITPKAIKANHKIVEQKLKAGRKVVVFLTLQDLQGDQIKEKHRQILTQRIDLLIVDETHFGARAESYGKILKITQFAGEKKHKHDNDDCENLAKVEESIKALDVYITLHLSGTPYRILMGGEFSPESIIAFYQFSDIVDAKKEWDDQHLQDDNFEEWDNPYFGFPQMIRFAFNPNESSRRRMAELKELGLTYTLSALLEPLSIKKVEDGQHKKFKHEAEILDLLKTIDGSREDDELFGFLDYPKIKDGNLCRHMVMVLPYCASCDAMEALLKAHAKEFRNLQEYEILNISGREEPDEFNTPGAVKERIKELEGQGRKTLTLTVNRMLTGSTVEEWDTMLFLKDTSSPQEYDQAIFRLQSPYVVSRPQLNSDGTPNVSLPPVKINMKPQTLLVDFDPCRMFVMQEKKAQIYNVNADQAGNSKLAERIEKELSISPIITLNADQHRMEQIKPLDIMNAVSAYSSNRGVLEEASEIGVDLALQNNPTVWSVIEKENELGSKMGFVSKPAEGEGSAIDTPSTNPEEPPPPSPGENTGENTGQEQDGLQSIVKRFRMYYTRILYYAFLTETEVISLADILDSCSKGSNQRIFKNLVLDKDILSAFLGMDKFVLRDLDYAIQHLSQLSHDGRKTPLERVAVADKKFGRLGESQIVTPALIADEMVMQFSDAFLVECVKKKRPILDIASKKGEFAAALFRRLKKLGYGVEDFQDLLYSIPTSSICYEFTRKVYGMLGLNIRNIAKKFTAYDLLNVKDSSGNISCPKIQTRLNQSKCFDDISMDDVVTEQLTGQENMKFEAIVGNPPYQFPKTGTSDQPIYHLFMQIAFSLAQISSLITPARFLFNAGKTPKEWNRKILNDNHFKVILYKSKSADVFPDVDLKGGVAVTLYDKRQSFKPIRTFSAFKKLNTILTKVVTCEGFVPISDNIYPQWKFNLCKLYTERPQYRSLIGSNGKERRLTTSIFSLSEIFTEKKEDPESFEILGLVKNNRTYRFVPKRYIESPSNTAMYKVIIPKSNGTGAIGEVLSTPIIGRPFIGYTQSFISIGSFVRFAHAEACLKYIKTKFVRAMLGTLKVTQDNPRETWANVPTQDFTSLSDIDWSKPISEIDRQLYKKYGLTAEEISFIESKIQPME